MPTIKDLVPVIKLGKTFMEEVESEGRNNGSEQRERENKQEIHTVRIDCHLEVFLRNGELKPGD